MTSVAQDPGSVPRMEMFSGCLFPVSPWVCGESFRGPFSVGKLTMSTSDQSVRPVIVLWARDV